MIEPDKVSVGGLLLGTPVEVVVSVLVPLTPFHLIVPVVVTELLLPGLQVAGPDPELVTVPPVMPYALDVHLLRVPVNSTVVVWVERLSGGLNVAEPFSMQDEPAADAAVGAKAQIAVVLANARAVAVAVAVTARKSQLFMGPPR